MKKPTVLMILDGFGLNPDPDPEGNAVAQANIAHIRGLMQQYPFVKGYASGLAVGLPDGQMGNSEVGHLNMGAGRIVYQDLTKITKSIEDGDFFANKALLAACEHVKANHSTLHLMGLLSDGGVHSHNSHVYALLELARRQQIPDVAVHCFMDGRDTPPTSGIEYLRELESRMKELGTGRIATVTGRYYAMDRDNRWDRVQKAYRGLTEGEGHRAADPLQALQASYDAGVTDEFVEPVVCTQADGSPAALVSRGDAVIFFNFRPDRAREITRAFLDDDFRGFPRKKIGDLVYTCFTDYDATIEGKLVAFNKEEPVNTLGAWVSSLGLSQLRLAETEKYAHVTFFFNGGVEVPNPGEDRILVPSPKVATYDLQPEMSAPAVGDKLVEAIESRKYDLIIVNFANPDMVGHTGVLSAAVKALETVDVQVGRAVEAAVRVNGQIFLCADHGNCEQMLDRETGEPFTAHTTNPVPFILINADPRYHLRENGKLCDIAPTLLALMGLPQPAEMTGRSLLSEN